MPRKSRTGVARLRAQAVLPPFALGGAGLVAGGVLGRILGRPSTAEVCSAGVKLTISDPGRFALKNAVRAAIVVPAAFVARARRCSNFRRWRCSAPSARSACCVFVDFGGTAAGAPPRLPRRLLGGRLPDDQPRHPLLAHHLAGGGGDGAGRLRDPLLRGDRRLHRRRLAGPDPHLRDRRDGRRPTSSEIPDRLAGWGVAGLFSLIAIFCLWPSRPPDRLRRGGAAALDEAGRPARGDGRRRATGGAAERGRRGTARRTLDGGLRRDRRRPQRLRLDARTGRAASAPAPRRSAGWSTTSTGSTRWPASSPRPAAVSQRLRRRARRGRNGGAGGAAARRRAAARQRPRRRRPRAARPLRRPPGDRPRLHGASSPSTGSRTTRSASPPS